MDGFFRPPGLLQDNWMVPGAPNLMDYNRHSQMMPRFPMMQPPPPIPVKPPEFSSNLNDLVQLQLQMLNNKQSFPQTNMFESSKPQQITSFGLPKPVPAPKPDNSLSDKYNPFVEDINDEDMDISDEEKESQSVGAGRKGTENKFKQSAAVRHSSEVKSGAAFYQGLILYIPPFEQLAHTYRGSPALKML